MIIKFSLRLPAVLLIILLCGSCYNPLMDEILGKFKDKETTVDNETTDTVDNEIEGDETAVHEHEWSGWIVTLESACTAEGVEARFCASDETHVETRAIAALGHDWEWVLTTAATTTAEGAETQVCKHDPSHKNDMRVIAKIQTYTITFNTMGGSVVASLTGIPHGETIASPIPPSSGYGAFEGWYSDEERTSYVDFDTYNVTENITLYAKWEAFYEIGDTGPGDGIIIYRNETGFIMTDTGETCYYLEAAPNNLGRINFIEAINSPGINTKIEGTKYEIGAGRDNTNRIISTHNNYAIAAKTCIDYRSGGKDDWFLPSRHELECLYENREFIGDFKYSMDYYWSSVQGWDSNTALAYMFKTSGGIDLESSLAKQASWYVHPMRAF